MCFAIGFRSQDWEDKMWNFVVEDVRLQIMHKDFKFIIILYSFKVASNGKRRQLASGCLNMKLYASLVPSQQQVKLKLNISSKKIVSAALNLTISCVFIREGKATYVYTIVYNFPLIPKIIYLLVFFQ